MKGTDATMRHFVESARVSLNMEGDYAMQEMSYMVDNISVRFDNSMRSRFRSVKLLGKLKLNEEEIVWFP